MWATGMVIEGVADAQKLAFKSDPVSGRAPVADGCTSAGC